MPVSSTSYSQIQVTCKIIFKSIEPVGSVAPRLSAGTSKIQTLEIACQDSSTLLCPAQSYPVPNYRYLECLCLYCFQAVFALQFLCFYRTCWFCQAEISNRG